METWNVRHPWAIKYPMKRQLLWLSQLNHCLGYCISNRSAGTNPSHSPLPIQFPANMSRWQEVPGWGDLDGISGSWLWHGPALAV